MGCENGKRAGGHGRAVSKSQVGYLCVIHVMIMQGAGIWVWKTVEQGENVCSVYKACAMDMQELEAQGPMAKGTFWGSI